MARFTPRTPSEPLPTARCPNRSLKQNLAPGAGISRALAQHTAQGESSVQHEPVAVQANQVSRRQHVQVDRERVVFALTRHFDDRERVVSKRLVFDVSKPFEHAFEGLAGGRPCCLLEGRRSRRRVLLSRGSSPKAAGSSLGALETALGGISLAGPVYRAVVSAICLCW